MPHPNSGKQPAIGRGVTAVLGPTNTGKTHYAIERMVAHESGLIGLPLRLLAREVYQRIAEKAGAASVALITGEERIVPPGARFHVCTVEAMPSETSASFVAIDEVQLAADLERGHVFTDRILNLRGRHETLLLGAQTVEPVLRDLLPGIEVIGRPRMSMLTYAGSKKITRMPPRSAIVAFSADEVYAIAELIRRQRGGAAVVLGSLSPRTRNAQVALYQSGDVDFLVATDAIGMGLNLDLDHVAFAQDRKFDGFQFRRLSASEMAQIAGRAGRHTMNGTFGVTGQVQPFEDELVERLETHVFDPAKVLVWRNRDLDFSSLDALRRSLEMPSANRLLMKSFPAVDLQALEALARDGDIAGRCHDPSMVGLLWEVCQTPDYRKISPGAHSELLSSLFEQLAGTGHLDEDWFARNVERTDRLDGDIDALSARIAQIRTWTYLSNRPEWLRNATHWQEKTRQIEDRLSDALHESLTKRFIDRRTSVLMKRLRENHHMEAQINGDGNVEVEGHPVGRLTGFRFIPDSTGDSPEARAANAAAMKALAAEITRRANRLAGAPNNDIILASDGMLRWLGEPVAKLTAGDDILKPRAILLADEQLSGPERDGVAARLDRWIANHVSNTLKPLVELRGDQTLEGMARGLAYRLVESLGNIERREVIDDVQALTQEMRAGLRRHGVRFGAYTIFMPALLKPGPAELLCLLWGLKEGNPGAAGLNEVPAILASGRTSTVWNREFGNEAYRLCGYRILGQKAVRLDILERLADLIRPALSWRPAAEGSKPDGAIDGRSFYVTPAMMSILGATHEDMELILKGLGYRGEPRLESDVRPQPAVPANARSGEGESSNTANSAETGSIPATVEATPDSESQADAEPVPAGSGGGSEISQDAPVADQPSEAAGPKMVLVWRPAGRQAPRAPGTESGRDREKRRSAHADGHQGKGGPKGKRGDPKGFRKHEERKVPSGRTEQKKPQREIDPNSPFAKLAALRESMKSGE